MRNDSIEVIVFPIPAIARNTMTNHVVGEYQDKIVDNTVLLPPEVKINDFIPKVIEKYIYICRLSSADFFFSLFFVFNIIDIT